MEKTIQHTTIRAITADMTIGEVVQNYPPIVDTLISFGVHCVGCGASYWETLEMGLKGHGGMNDQEFEEALVKMNRVVAETAIQEEIKVTPGALMKIAEIVEGKKGLRISVKAGGCDGMQYIFELTEKEKGDVVIRDVEAPIFVNKESFDKLKGSRIDYVDAGFKVTNPNAKAACSCE